MGGRCPASWGWGEALSRPVSKAVHAESRCEKSHYPVGKYLMDHSGRNVKARRERKGGERTSDEQKKSLAERRRAAR